MFARERTFESRPEQVDELVHTALEKVLPHLKRYEDFNWALALANLLGDGGGTALATEDDFQASRSISA